MKSIDERAIELANKSRYWTPGGFHDARIDFFREGLTELAAVLLGPMNHGPFTIPEISDAELKRRSCIRPVVRIDGRLRWIRKVNPRTVAFTWSPKPLKVVRGLEKLVTIETLHRYGYYGFFKPSIAEVVSQIPDDLLALVMAFETIGPDDATDLNKESKALNAGFHVARTTLYRRRSRPNAASGRPEDRL